MQLAELTIEVRRKDIKNVHLSVHPPLGRVRMAAPHHIDDATLRAFTLDKLGWIRAQQQKLRLQERESELEYVTRESHFVWGKRYLLKVLEADAAPKVQWQGRRLTLYTRADSSVTQRAQTMEVWCREELRRELAPMLERWQTRIGVSVAGVFVQRMRTRWGSCNDRNRTIRLNTDLARKPRECLEYILVHELVHLLERKHNARFSALMDQFMPEWRQRRNLLNRLPLRHEEWTY
jgi:predicted metal-dependent hydrolase